MNALPRPDVSEYAEYYRTYIDAAPDGDIVEHLRSQGRATREALGGVGEELASFRYAEGKWSVKQVLGHIVDGERLFAHRALVIARGDDVDQPSMDQDLWMSSVDFDRRTLTSLVAEYAVVRAASLALFETFDADVGARQGRASGNPFTVRSLVWCVAGHELHHLNVLRERYRVG